MSQTWLLSQSSGSAATSITIDNTSYTVNDSFLSSTLSTLGFLQKVNEYYAQTSSVSQGFRKGTVYLSVYERQKIYENASEFLYIVKYGSGVNLWNQGLTLNQVNLKWGHFLNDPTAAQRAQNEVELFSPISLNYTPSNENRNIVAWFYAKISHDPDETAYTVYGNTVHETYLQKYGYNSYGSIALCDSSIQLNATINNSSAKTTIQTMWTTFSTYECNPSVFLDDDSSFGHTGCTVTVWTYRTQSYAPARYITLTVKNSNNETVISEMPLAGNINNNANAIEYTTYPVEGYLTPGTSYSLSVTCYPFNTAGKAITSTQSYITRDNAIITDIQFSTIAIDENDIFNYDSASPPLYSVFQATIQRWQGNQKYRFIIADEPSWRQNWTNGQLNYIAKTPVLTDTYADGVEKTIEVVPHDSTEQANFVHDLRRNTRTDGQSAGSTDEPRYLFIVTCNAQGEPEIDSSNDSKEIIIYTSSTYSSPVLPNNISLVENQATIANVLDWENHFLQSASDIKLTYDQITPRTESDLNLLTISVHKIVSQSSELICTIIKPSDSIPNAPTGNTIDIGGIKEYGEYSLTVEVADSRGYTTSATKNFTVLQYQPPVIDAATIERSGGLGDLIIYSVSGIYTQIKDQNNNRLNNIKNAYIYFESENRRISIQKDSDGNPLPTSGTKYWLDNSNSDSPSFSGENENDFLEIEPDSDIRFVLGIRDQFETSFHEEIVPAARPIVAIRKRVNDGHLAKVGINTNNPSVELDVNGTIRADDITITVNGSEENLSSLIAGILADIANL